VRTSEPAGTLPELGESSDAAEPAAEVVVLTER
jgi:hypothetical protein